MEKLIYGAGGDSSEDTESATTATEYPDTLRSKSYVKVVDLLGEGEFEEVLVGGLKGLYLDDTPVMNQDGSYNYTGLSVESRTGTLGQSRMTLGSTTENTASVGVEMKYNLPVETTVTGSGIDLIRVSIRLPSLTSTNTTTGDVTGSSVSFRVEWKDQADISWTNVGDQVISGKSSSEYERQVSFRISGDGPWIVRCTRLTADSTSSYLQNKTYFSTVTSVLEERLRYPGSVLVGMQVDAEQFSSVPSRSFLCKCLKVKVPTNYDPLTRVYSGVWDGSFKVAWTDNPAWCFYDLITNTRYGLGGRIPESSVDKAELYVIGKYCDGLVPGENGVMEPRFTCNIVIQTKEAAYKVIQDFASIFRGMTYWGQGTIVPVQDSPKTASYAFNNTSVQDGVFTYQSSSLATRYNATCVTWNNPDNFYRREVEYVEDQDLITELGYVNQTDIVAMGCTSRAMARRVGKWLIYTNNYQTDIVTFTTGGDGAIPRPGDVLQISDTLRAQDRRGGRIASSTLNGVVLDKAMLFTAGTVYTISLIDTDGALVEKTFTGAGTTTDSVTFSTPLAKALAKDSIFIVSDSNVEPQLFKVASISDKGNGAYEISAVEHNESKYAYVEKAEPLIEPALPTQTVYPVTNLLAKEVVYLETGFFVSKIEVSWSAPKFASSYKIRVRKPDGSIVSEKKYTNFYELFGATNGTYTVDVVASNYIGVDASVVTTTVVVGGKDWLPSDVTGFTASQDLTGVTLKWNASPDVDVNRYEIRLFNGSVGYTWDNSTIVSSELSSTSFRMAPRGSTTTYLIKAVDTSGNKSVNAATAIVAVGNPVAPTLQASPSLFSIIFNWVFGDARSDIRHTEIWRSDSNNINAATRLTSEPSPSASYTQIGLEPGQGGYYWARVVDLFGNTSAYSSVVYAVSDTDPSSILTQLQGALGMQQMADEIAAPIAQIPGVSTDILQRALDIDVLTDRSLFERAVTDATIKVDPITGKIELLATAEVTTEVEARLTQVEVDLNAAEGTLTSTVATLSTVEGDLSSAQSQIAQLANKVSLGVSDVQIAKIADQISGDLTVESAAAAQSLAEAAMRQALGLDDSTDKELASRSRISIAELDIAAMSDELSAEASARLTLAAIVGEQKAVLEEEQVVRATADTAEANARLALASTVNSNNLTLTAAIQTEQSTRSSADSALATRATNLEASVNSPTTGLTTKASIAYVDQAEADAVSASASYTNTIQSQLNTSISSVQQYATSTANSLGAVEAKWGVTTQVMSDGVRSVAGIQLLSGVPGQSTFAVLADKFLVYQPNGGGYPKQIMSVGTINGVSALGFDGSAIFDGTVVARSIDSRGLAIRDSGGNIILGAGTALSPSYAAAGTLNSELTPAINSAAATATWAYVSGAGKPADYATVGATFGSNVYGQITPSNVTTYIANGAIQNAQIGYAAIMYANIGDAQIGTAKIADLQVNGNKITGVVSGSVYLGAGASVWIPTVGGRTPLVGMLSVTVDPLYSQPIGLGRVVAGTGGFTLINESYQMVTNQMENGSETVKAPLPATFIYYYL